MSWRHLSASLLLLACSVSVGLAEGPKRVLLLAGKKSHGPGAHEHMAGMKILAQCLEGVSGLQASIQSADGPWPEGPALMKAADGIVMYLDYGMHWEQATPERQKALEALMARGGGVVALHWAIGGQDEKYIPFHLKLVGGCHGGSDRQYTFGTAAMKVVAPDHPIAAGVKDFSLSDEFYYQLKWAKEGRITPILTATIKEFPNQPIVWAFERPDGGRSVGVAAMHELKTWGLVECRRLIAQAVLWTVRLPVPKEGLAVKVKDE